MDRLLASRSCLSHSATCSCSQSAAWEKTPAQAGHFGACRAMGRPSYALQRQCPQTGLFHVHATIDAVRLPIRAAERTVALLAFENAASSPVADLMDAAQRQKMASEVNAAILKSQHQVGTSAWSVIIH